MTTRNTGTITVDAKGFDEAIVLCKQQLADMDTVIRARITLVSVDLHIKAAGGLSRFTFSYETT